MSPSPPKVARYFFFKINPTHDRDSLLRRRLTDFRINVMRANEKDGLAQLIVTQIETLLPSSAEQVRAYFPQISEVYNVSDEDIEVLLETLRDKTDM